MSTVNLNLVAAPFTINPAWTVEQFHQNLAASLTTSTTTSNVMLGQIGGSAPASNVGPWMKASSTWYAWDGTKYIPATLKVGDDDFQVTLTGTPTENRTLTLPDKDGILALTSDVFTGRGTKTITSAEPTMDWSLYSSFAASLTTDITPVITNSLPGQEVQVVIHNASGGAAVITWPTEITWDNDTEPTDPLDGFSVVVILFNVGGVIYGRSFGSDFA